MGLKPQTLSTYRYFAIHFQEEARTASAAAATAPSGAVVYAQRWAESRARKARTYLRRLIEDGFRGEGGEW